MLYYTQGYIKVNGTKIHYYRTGGDKPPFILLHGATDNGLCWTPVAEILAKDYDVIMPDAQGHGLSDRFGTDFVFKDFTLQVLGLMQELNLVKPVIMGHSMGAGTAGDIASEHSDLLKAIILEDPAWQDAAPAADKNSDEMKKQRDEFIKMLTGYAKQSRDELIAKCKEEHPGWSEAEILPWADAKHQFDPALFTTIQLNLPSYVELAPKIKCPTLLITSDAGIVSAETARHASELWQAREPLHWVQIKNAGHNIRREQFKIFFDTLTGFLRGYSTTE